MSRPQEWAHLLLLAGPNAAPPQGKLDLREDCAWGHVGGHQGWCSRHPQMSQHKVIAPDKLLVKKQQLLPPPPTLQGSQDKGDIPLNLHGADLNQKSRE